MIISFISMKENISFRGAGRVKDADFLSLTVCCSKRSARMSLLPYRQAVFAYCMGSNR